MGPNPEHSREESGGAGGQPSCAVQPHSRLSAKQLCEERGWRLPVIRAVERLAGAVSKCEVCGDEAKLRATHRETLAA